MIRRRKLLLGLLFFGLILVAGAGWWWYTQSHALPFKIALRGSRSSDGNLGVSGGNLVVVAPKPGILFGIVSKPGGQERFTYLILFRMAYELTTEPNQPLQQAGSAAWRSGVWSVSQAGPLLLNFIVTNLSDAKSPKRG